MVGRIREGFERVVYGDRSRHRMSQREQDAYRRQLVILGVTVTTVLVVLILAIGAIYQYVYLPRQTVAAVDGVSISRAEYWDYRKYQLLGEWRQYQQMIQMVGQDQAQQYQEMASEASRDYQNVENDPVDPVTLNEMIENRIIMMSVDDFGVEISDADIDQQLVRYFTGQVVGVPLPTPEVDPTAVAWAEATAEARQAEFEAQQAELERQQAEAEDANGDDPQADDGSTDEAEPTTDASDEVSDDAAESTPEPTPDTGDADESSDDEAETEPMPTPEPTPTPSEAEIRATATVVEEQHREFVLEEAGMSEERFIEWFVKPEIARERIRMQLASEIPARAEQVHAAHILVATEEAANLIRNDSLAERDFDEVAREQSADTTTAENGGDLGWFPRGIMVSEFEEVVFSLEPGEISQPFQSEFGWHIVMVMDREDNRPVDVSVLTNLRNQTFATWLQERKQSADIDTRGTEIVDTDALPPTQFTPPPSAPPPPPPTPGPEDQFELPEFTVEGGFDPEDLTDPPDDEDPEDD